MKWIYDDGGRAAAGFKGKTGDCVARSIAIAAELPYAEVYAALAQVNKASKSRCKVAGLKSIRDGVDTRCAGFKRYMAGIGWEWTPTMHIGQGCKVHFVAEELPPGRLIIAVSKHYTCVIDRVIYDIFNPSRGETYYYNPDQSTGKTILDRISPDRCVYGYWRTIVNQPLFID